MITFTWSIATCEHDVATGGITVAHWRCNATDGEFSALAYGTCGFEFNAAASTFKPYADITESQVIEWVHGVVDKFAIADQLAAKIESEKNPTSASGTPWGS